MTLTPGGAREEHIDEIAREITNEIRCEERARERITESPVEGDVYLLKILLGVIDNQNAALREYEARAASPDSKLEAYRKALEATKAEKTARERLSNNGRNEANKGRGIPTGGDLHLCEMLIQQLNEARKALAAGG